MVNIIFVSNELLILAYFGIFNEYALHCSVLFCSVFFFYLQSLATSQHTAVVVWVEFTKISPCSETNAESK